MRIVPVAKSGSLIASSLEAWEPKTHPIGG
jgi:hypothetical protein